jgi:MFS family permease
MAQTDLRLRGVLAPLSYPVYRRLLLSNALWWQTLAMWTVVAGALVLDLTDSALAVSLLSFWRRAAQLSIGTFAGPISDRIGRRGTLVLTQLTILGAMVAIFLLFFSQQLLAWQMTVAAFLIGAAWAVDLPARNSLVPDLVGGQGTVDAMLLESFVQGIVGSIGALLAGWLLAYLGPTGTFAVLIGLTTINVALLRRFSRAEIARTQPVAGVSLWQSIGQGIHYVRHNGPILAVTLTSAALNTLIFPAMSLLPVFARDVLERGPVGLGLLNAGYNIGTFVGLCMVNYLRHRITIGWLFTIGTLLQCGSLVIFALSKDYTLSWLMIFCAGLGQAGFHTLRNVIILTTASNEMRGRAMSTVVLTQGVGLPGELQTGILAESLGAPTTVAAQAGVATALSAAIALALPNLRRPPETERCTS